jgi:hypothetical protein
MAKNYMQDSDACYAVKYLQPDLDQLEKSWGNIDIAIKAKYLSVVKHPDIAKMRAWAACDPLSNGDSYFLGLDRLVIPHASPHNIPSGNYDSHIQVITTHADPLRKSIHFLHQYMWPFIMLPSVLFYKEGLYISMQHSSIHWRGSPFTSLPHDHLVRVEMITSILILAVSILL